MRTSMSALVAIALAGFSCNANAQAPCSELTRLRGEAVEAAKPTRAWPGRCEAHIRAAMAWDDVLQYARDHREACGVSPIALSDFEKYRGEAERMRDNLCAGRPMQPFPPEIIRR
jgi:hypothetical protein